MATTMTTKGQVTVPKSIRDLLDLGPGSQVEFKRDADGRIVMEKAGAAQPSRFARFRGHAGPGLSTEEIMALTRGER